MAYRTLSAVILLVSVGCGAHLPPQIITKVETQTVEVPGAVPRVPPAELTAAITPPLPKFVSPDDKTATSALTAEGERQFQALIEELLSRIAAWQAWAKE